MADAYLTHSFIDRAPAGTGVNLEVDGRRVAPGGGCWDGVSFVSMAILFMLASS